MPDFNNSKISLKELTRALKGKGAAAPCNSCGGKDFNISDEDVYDARAAIPYFRFPGWDLGGAKTIDVVMMVCESCGTIRLVHRPTLAEWLAKNPS